LPVKPPPKRSSVIPAPSVPGSHAATNAFAFGTWLLMTTGRPDSRIAMHFLVCEQMSESCDELSLPKASVEESPFPSAYGVSPPTQIPTSPL